MLFNSYIFICIFLPVTLTVYYLLLRTRYWGYSNLWLLLASSFFYIWWRPANFFVLFPSLCVNYFLGLKITSITHHARRRLFLTLGIIFNLTLLGYFKYINFGIDIVNNVFGLGRTPWDVVLPLGISFFTFQQIAYLVDAYRESTREKNFINYTLFVMFFPHLIAGPIVHPKVILPQLAKRRDYHAKVRNLSVGFTLLAIGLFKKVMLADSLSGYAGSAFGAAGEGIRLTFFDAWIGVLAYALQIYFDFSGYSDMAIGLAQMFGIRISLNFFSPYKAMSIIDFWKRWHITLSSFLKDYLYIPLGGNRCGLARRYINLLLTMVIGGLWHGAAWNFIFWGFLHGSFLTVNHIWRRIWEKLALPREASFLARFLATGLTFGCVLVGWVFFRAQNMPAAFQMLLAMAGKNGVVLWNNYYQVLNRLGGWGDFLAHQGIQFDTLRIFALKPVLLISALLAGVWLLPNAQQLMASYHPSTFDAKFDPPGRFQWEPSFVWAIFCGLLFAVSFLSISKASEFIYFQF